MSVEVEEKELEAIEESLSILNSTMPPFAVGVFLGGVVAGNSIPLLGDTVFYILFAIFSILGLIVILKARKIRAIIKRASI